MFRNIQAWNFAVHCKNHAEPPENRGGSLFFHHFAPERLYMIHTSAGKPLYN